jgi:PTH2 family peptidyl-tRNA hydrolase
MADNWGLSLIRKIQKERNDEILYNEALGIDMNIAPLNNNVHIERRTLLNTDFGAMDSAGMPYGNKDLAPVKKPKQVILVRADLNMPVGKIASQVAHASMKVFFDRAEAPNALTQFGMVPGDEDLVIQMTPEMWLWKQGEFTKIVLAVNSEDELMLMLGKAHAKGLPCAIIEDNGHTVFNGQKTYTTCAIGPANADDIDAITGHLKLLK